MPFLFHCFPFQGGRANTSLWEFYSTHPCEQMKQKKLWLTSLSRFQDGLGSVSATLWSLKEMKDWASVFKCWPGKCFKQGGGRGQEDLLVCLCWAASTITEVVTNSDTGVDFRFPKISVLSRTVSDDKVGALGNEKFSTGTLGINRRWGGTKGKSGIQRWSHL